MPSSPGWSRSPGWCCCRSPDQTLGREAVELDQQLGQALRGVVDQGAPALGIGVGGVAAGARRVEVLRLPGELAGAGRRQQAMSPSPSRSRISGRKSAERAGMDTVANLVLREQAGR